MIKVLFNNRKAQHLSEYAIVIGMIIAVLMAMRPFVTRSVQAHLFDALGEFGDPEYVDPYNSLFGEGNVISGLSSVSTNTIHNRSGVDYIERNLTKEKTEQKAESVEMELLGIIE